MADEQKRAQKRPGKCIYVFRIAKAFTVPKLAVERVRC
jgi:hypothetical protein